MYSNDGCTYSNEPPFESIVLRKQQVRPSLVRQYQCLTQSMPRNIILRIRNNVIGTVYPNVTWCWG